MRLWVGGTDVDRQWWFQVFSLAKRSDICTIDDHGACFRHPDCVETVVMTPEISIKPKNHWC